MGTRIKILTDVESSRVCCTQGKKKQELCGMTLRFLAEKMNWMVTPSNPKTFTLSSFLFSSSLYPCKCTLLQLIPSDLCNYFPVLHISTVTFIIFMAAEQFTMLSQLSFLQLLNVHTLHAWLPRDFFGSQHFSRDQMSKEREPLGEGYWKSVASRTSEAAALVGEAWVTVLHVETAELSKRTYHPWAS